MDCSFSQIDQLAYLGAFTCTVLELFPFTSMVFHLALLLMLTEKATLFPPYLKAK